MNGPNSAHRHNAHPQSLNSKVFASKIHAFIFCAIVSAVGHAQELESERIEPSEELSAPERWGRAQAKAFAESEIVLTRSASNLPFLPFAYLGGTHYGAALIQDPNLSEEDLGYQQNTASTFAGLPFLMGERDALIVGGYASRSEFSLNRDTNSLANDFTVNSAALGLGWFHQNSDRWQTLAFAMPFYNRTDLANGSDYWQTMGGVFTRYTQNESLWWAFGVFADHTPFDTYALPYAGFSWTINPEWSVSAMMPWPQVTYAPDSNRFISLGASIAGSAWAVDQTTGEASIDLNAFDLGVSYNQRLSGWLWGSISAGVGGLRGLRVESNGSLQPAEFDVTRSPFLRINLTMRPSALF